MADWGVGGYYWISTCTRLNWIGWTGISWIVQIFDFLCSFSYCILVFLFWFALFDRLPAIIRGLGVWLKIYSEIQLYTRKLSYPWQEEEEDEGLPYRRGWLPTARMKVHRIRTQGWETLTWSHVYIVHSFILLAIYEDYHFYSFHILVTSIAIVFNLCFIHYIIIAAFWERWGPFI